MLRSLFGEPGWFTRDRPIGLPLLSVALCFCPRAGQLFLGWPAPLFRGGKRYSADQKKFWPRREQLIDVVDARCDNMESRLCCDSPKPPF